MDRTFILHANGAKLLTDVLGLTCVSYGDASRAIQVKAVLQKLRKAIIDVGVLSRIEGLWWFFSVTERSELEPSAVSLLLGRDEGVHLAEACVALERQLAGASCSRSPTNAERPVPVPTDGARRGPLE